MGKRTKSGPFDFPAKVEDAKARARAIALLKDKGVRLPTFAELAEPDLIAQGRSRRALGKVGPDDPHPAQPAPRPLVQRPRPHGPRRHAGARRAARGADRRGGAHRRGAGRAVPDDPRAQGAGRLRLPGAAPGVAGASIRRGSARCGRRPATTAAAASRSRSILGCRGVAVLPAGMSQERFDWLSAMGERARGHRAHAGHGIQRQGDLRQLRRARARSGQRDRQPVQRVRQLPGALALHRAGARERLRGAAQEVART